VLLARASGGEGQGMGSGHLLTREARLDGDAGLFDAAVSEEVAACTSGEESTLGGVLACSMRWTVPTPKRGLFVLPTE
jgi:hypothetical protein